MLQPGEVLPSGLGTMKPLGHVDFYPNGGIRQPGCALSNWQSILSNPEGILLDFGIACNHARAVKIYSDSLSSTCKTIGYECVTYESFKKVKTTKKHDSKTLFFRHI